MRENKGQNIYGCNIFPGDSIVDFSERCDSTRESLAPPRTRYTRQNPDPNLVKPVDNLEKLLGEIKKNNLSYSPILTRSTSLSTEAVQIIPDFQFECKFQHTRSKSDSDIKEVVEYLASVF